MYFGDDVLTTNEAIEYLKISKPTFLKYVHSSRIKAVKAGNGWRVHRSELLRFLNVGEGQSSVSGDSAAELVARRRAR